MFSIFAEQSEHLQTWCERWLIRLFELKDWASNTKLGPPRHVIAAFANGWLIAVSGTFGSFKGYVIVESLRQTEMIWALKDVSFQVKQGEVLGVIGRNGSGKSTLLKILSGITDPTTGEANINGRAGSLLEVGTGFHPELSGRENVYLNGAILGIKKAEIERKFDEIVAFSEVRKFIDTPVKFYSSGMYIRLAFAVAAHLEPEILLLDEVLAVGDAAFQQKCLGKWGLLQKKGEPLCLSAIIWLQCVICVADTLTRIWPPRESGTH